MFKLVMAILMVGAISCIAPAQDAPKKEVAAADYETLLAKVKGGDTSISFKDLRIAYSKTSGYSYSGPDKENREKFTKPYSEKNYKNALKEAEKYLETMYVDANAHFVAYNSAKSLGDQKKSDFHKAVLLGLLESIKDGNDGAGPKTPFVVISIDEEYTLLRFLGLRFLSQSLERAEGHTFDVFEVGTADGKTGKLYFNIDIVWAAETKLFTK